jgi:hypothetical protein
MPTERIGPPPASQGAAAEIVTAARFTTVLRA